MRQLYMLTLISFNWKMKIFLTMLAAVSISGMSNEPRHDQFETPIEDIHELRRENERLRLGMNKLQEQVDTLGAELQEMSALCGHYEREKQQMESVAEERLLGWTQCNAQLGHLWDHYQSRQSIVDDQIIHTPKGIVFPDYTYWHQNSWSAYPEPPSLLTAVPIPLDDTAIGPQASEIDRGFPPTFAPVQAQPYASKVMMEQPPPSEEIRH